MVPYTPDPTQTGFISHEQEEAGGLISFEECIRLEEHGLSDYLKERSQEPVRGCLQHLVIEHTASEYKAQQKKKKEEEWRKKALLGQFITRIEASEDTWGWLRRGKLKKETEGMIPAAQDQALPTKHRKIGNHLECQIRPGNAWN